MYAVSCIKIRMFNEYICIINIFCTYPAAHFFNGLVKVLPFVEVSTGSYPALKGPLDRIHRRWLRRAAKLALCLIALSLSYGLAVSVLGLPREAPGMLALLLVLGLFTFLLLDRLLSRLILSWRRKWRRLLGFDRRK